MTMFAWLSAPHSIPRTMLHSTMIPTTGNGFAGQNYIGLRNLDIDKIIDDLEVVCEPSANHALWIRLQQQYTELLPALPLFFRADAYLKPKALTGIVPTGHQYPSTLWIENWRWTP
ncbi:hypothetical protein CCP2SC5_1650005 [Azospirillaceae bacterium]